MVDVVVGTRTPRRKDRCERTSIPNLFGRWGHRIVLDGVVAELVGKTREVVLNHRLHLCGPNAAKLRAYAKASGMEAWQKTELTDATAKVVIYEAIVEGRLEAPKHLARSVHDLYFEV